MYKQDTIAAVATPPGEGGLAVIRVSGPDAERIAGGIFLRVNGTSGPLKSHRLYHGRIIDRAEGPVLDDVLLALMRKPRSYTAEDVVEIHCHGGPYLVRRILGVVLREGARHAEPGEFTKRAFLNGRLDLSQAEAVVDLIRARTDDAVSLALSQVDGALSKWVHLMREELLGVLAQVEAAIDFPEEEIELLQRDALGRKITALGRKIHDVSVTYAQGRLFREGARVCICGRPNVGKSSLLNALLGEERVIVTPIPGTTRDVVEETLNIRGLPVVLWDTAGVRGSEDPVERLGIERSEDHIRKADALVVVMDGAAELQPEDRGLLQLTGTKKRLLAVNKNDLPRKLDIAELAAAVGEPVFISAKTGDGIAAMKEAMRDLVLGTPPQTDVVVTRVRQKSALERSSAALDRAAGTLEAGYAAEFVAADLNEARVGLEEIVGLINTDDILERIFNEFCIGK